MKTSFCAAVAIIATGLSTAEVVTQVVRKRRFGLFLCCWRLKEHSPHLMRRVLPKVCRRVIGNRYLAVCLCAPRTMGARYRTCTCVARVQTYCTVLYSCGTTGVCSQPSRETYGAGNDNTTVVNLIPDQFKYEYTTRSLHLSPSSYLAQRKTQLAWSDCARFTSNSTGMPRPSSARLPTPGRFCCQHRYSHHATRMDHPN